MLRRDQREAVAELRELEATRLDALQYGVWDAAVDGVHQVINDVLRIMDRRAKLYGLDAPTQVGGVEGEPLTVVVDANLFPTPYRGVMLEDAERFANREDQQ